MGFFFQCLFFNFSYFCEADGLQKGDDRINDNFMKPKNESKVPHASDLREVEKIKKGLLAPSEKKKSAVQTLFYGGLKQIKDINR